MATYSENVANAISSLTFNELQDVCRILNITINIKSKQQLPEKQIHHYELWLVELNGSELELVKAIKEELQISLKEAADLVNACPSKLLDADIVEYLQTKVRSLNYRCSYGVYEIKSIYK